MFGNNAIRVTFILLLGLSGCQQRTNDSVSKEADNPPKESSKSNTPALVVPTAPRMPTATVYVDNLVRAWGRGTEDGKYENKVIVVTGRVKAVRKQEEGTVIIIASSSWGGELGTPVTRLEMDCFFDKSKLVDPIQVVEGDDLRILGRCKGIEKGRLRLEECELTK